jgi:hypothetical protein
LKEWRCYLEGSEVTLVTDHKPNTYFDTKTVLSRRMARWVEDLAPFDYKWEHKNGRNNVADPLSRDPRMEQAAMLILSLQIADGSPRRIQPEDCGNSVFLSSGVTECKPRQSKKRDKSPGGEVPQVTTFKPKGKKAGKRAKMSITERIIAGYQADPVFTSPKGQTKRKKYFSRDGLWFRKDRKNREKVVVPDDKSLRNDIIAELHCPVYMGHIGSGKTLELVQRTFYWKGVTNDVETFVSECYECQTNKPSTRKTGGQMNPTEIPEEFWDCISCDLITQLPQTKTGYDAIAVFVDGLSKMTHIVPCTTTINAERFAELYINNVVKHHGVPKKIISDRDTRFTGHFLKELMKMMGTRQAFSTAFHPQTDGQTERMNRVIEDMIRHYVGPYHDDWDVHLALIEFAINNSWQESIQSTPFRAHYGYDPRTPLAREISAKSPAAQSFWDTHTERRDHCIKCIKAAQDRQKRYYDKSRRDVSFILGQEVLLSTRNVKFKATGKPKFLPRYIGPYTIIEVIGPRNTKGEVTTVTACKLDLPKAMKIHPVFHVSLLKPYKSDGKSHSTGPLVYDSDGSPLWEAELIIKERSARGRRPGRGQMEEQAGAG